MCPRLSDASTFSAICLFLATLAPYSPHYFRYFPPSHCCERMPVSRDARQVEAPEPSRQTTHLPRAAPTRTRSSHRATPALRDTDTPSLSMLAPAAHGALIAAPHHPCCLLPAPIDLHRAQIRCRHAQRYAARAFDPRSALYPWLINAQCGFPIRPASITLCLSKLAPRN